MTSRLVLPSARCLSAYSMVCWSRTMRPVAIRDQGVVGLAVPSPVEAMADDTSRGCLEGLVPRNAVKNPSEVMRSGLSQAVLSRVAAVSAPIG